jgi:protein-L-isoaspartate(D-aspartate) O-methyltransferase
MNIEQARFNMIEQQIRPWEVLDQSVLSLLSIVKREDFVPPAMRALAFVDMQVPLPNGRSMLEPKVEARLLQELAVQRHERVLEIGAGSGYMAALLAHKAQHVTTVEIDPELARFASDNLRRARVMNVRVIEADASAGLMVDGPFDVIVLSGSVAEVPRALLGQLKPGGRLSAIVGQLPMMHAVLVTRGEGQAAGHSTVELFDTVAPRLIGFGEPSRFTF